MRFATIFAALALTSASVMGLAVPSETSGDSRDVLMKRSFDDLYVSMCGNPSSGELSFVFLGHGVAPYTLTSKNATDGSLFQTIDSGITDSRYEWYTDGYTPESAEFYLEVTDSSGSVAQSGKFTMGLHPGRA